MTTKPVLLTATGLEELKEAREIATEHEPGDGFEEMVGGNADVLRISRYVDHLQQRRNIFLLQNLRQETVFVVMTGPK